MSDTGFPNMRRLTRSHKTCLVLSVVKAIRSFRLVKTARMQSLVVVNKKEHGKLEISRVKDLLACFKENQVTRRKTLVKTHGKQTK